MASLVPLRLTESNDETIDLTVTSPVPVNVGACVFQLYIKTSADHADDAAIVLTVGAGLTVTTTGTATSFDLIAEVPAADLATPGKLFWKLDMIVAGKRHTCMYGPLTIRDI